MYLLSGSLQKRFASHGFYTSRNIASVLFQGAEVLHLGVQTFMNGLQMISDLLKLKVKFDVYVPYSGKTFYQLLKNIYEFSPVCFLAIDVYSPNCFW